MLQRRRIDEERVGALAVRDRADVREVDFLRHSEVVDQRAGGGDGGRVAVEAEPFETSGAELIEERLPRGLQLERRAVDRRRLQTRSRDRRNRGDRRAAIESGDDNLAGFEDGELVGERLHAVDARVLGGAEFSCGQIEERDADRVARLNPSCDACRRDRHQKCRLARVEIAGIGQRAGRDDADDFASDEALRLARVLDLIADRDAEPLFHQPSDVAIDGVKRDAAHRDPAAIRILRSRGERDLERARGDEGVFVEHLVEVAHPEEEDGIAMQLLDVQVLPHRGCHRR